MPRFIDIGSIASHIETTPVEKLAVFLLDIQSVTSMNMLILAKQVELQAGRKEGRALMKKIVGELAKAKLLGVIPPCPATEYTLATPKLTLGEFSLILERFTPMERKLIAFALAADISLTEASFLQQKEKKIKANINKWSDDVRRLIASVPSHIHSEYVFWELNSQGKPSVMAGFESRFRIVTKASWPVFLELCKDMIPLDTRLDGKEFRQYLVEQYGADQAT